MTRTPQATFNELVHRVSALVAGYSGQVQRLAELYAEKTHVSFPMTPDAQPLRTRAELRAHFADVASRLRGGVAGMRAEDVRIHQTTDPEVIVAEFRYQAGQPEGGLRLPNVFVMRVRDGEIIESRDYSASAA